MRRGARTALVVGLVAAVVGDPGGVVAAERSRPAAIDVGVLTPEGTDRYEVVGDATALGVRAPDANRGSNLRVALVPEDAPVAADQEACVTWLGPVGSEIQPGVVLRHRVAGGRTRAVMVTQNIYYVARQHVNVHVVDTAADRPLLLVGSVEVEGSIGRIPAMRPLPWRFCARIRDDLVEIRAWSTGDPEPPWGDPDASGTVTLPAVAPTSGRPGGYVGHLPPGAATLMVDLDVRSLDLRAVLGRVTGALRRLEHRLALVV